MCVDSNALESYGLESQLTLNDAMNGSEADGWKKAMETEYKPMMEKETWDLVQLPPNRKAIKGRWVFQRKFDGDGNVIRHKARYVAKGYLQKEGIDFDETYSPTMKHTTLRILLALGNAKNMEMRQMDIRTAFLNGDLQEEVYIQQTQLFEVQGKENLVCRLKKALYGLRQASRAWSQTLSAYLIEQGYVQSKVDARVFVRKDVKGKIVSIIACWVDDMLVLAVDDTEMTNCRKEISSKFEVSSEEELSHFWGMKMERDRWNGILHVSNGAYIQRLLEQYKMEYCHPTKVPIFPDDRVQLCDDSRPKTEADREQMKHYPYRQLVGCLLHLSVTCQPDIAFVTGVLSRFNSNPGLPHWQAAKKVLRYLKKTKDLRLECKCSGDKPKLVGYADADYSNCSDTRKSVSGYIFMLGEGAVSWSSKKQPTVTLSKAAAEYIAMAAAVQEALWIRSLLDELDLGVDTNPLHIFQDNQAAISYTRNPKDHSRMKPSSTAIRVTCWPMASRRVWVRRCLRDCVRGFV